MTVFEYVLLNFYVSHEKEKKKVCIYVTSLLRKGKIMDFPSSCSFFGHGTYIALAYFVNVEVALENIC